MNSILLNKNKLKEHVLSLLFPIECIGCKAEGQWLCQSCFRELQLKEEQYCLHCKKPNKYGEFCAKCKPLYSLNGIWIAGDYEQKILAQLIKNLKYRLAKNISQVLGNFLAHFLKNLISQSRFNKNDILEKLNWRKFEEMKDAPNIFNSLSDAIIIPVPLHKKRQKWRGFNQAQILAEELTNNIKLPVSNQLIRIKHKQAQAKLGEADRKNNLQGCFAWRGEKLTGQNIIIIDDVTTTGSTLNECAKIVKEVGAGEIWGLVVAKG